MPVTQPPGNFWNPVATFEKFQNFSKVSRFAPVRIPIPAEPGEWLGSCNIAHGLLKQPGSITLKHLHTLCRVLHCTPNDLLSYTPATDDALPATHPLHTLIRKEVPASLPQQLRTLPPEHLDKVLELIEQLKAEEKGE